MLPVFEERVLVVAGEGWGSHIEQYCSCCTSSDERQQRRKLVAPFLCKDNSSVLTCLTFLRWAGPRVAAVRRSSLGLLPIQLAVLHSMLGPEEILRAGGVERSP